MDGISKGLLSVLLTMAMSIGCRGGEQGGAVLRLCEGDAQSGARELVLNPHWTVGGSRDTRLHLDPLYFAVPAPDGGLSFTSAYNARVMTLNRDGSIRSEMGRAGQGPGEWSTGTGSDLSWHGDTLRVVQRRPPRVHSFSRDGEVFGAKDVRAELDESVTLLRVFRNGTLLGALPSRVGSRDFRLVHWPESMAEGDSLGLFRSQLTYRVNWPDGAFAVGMKPIHDDIVKAMAPDGSWLVLVDRPAATSAGPAEYRIRRIGENGERLLDRMVCYVPLPVPPEARADTVREKVEMLGASRTPPRGFAAQVEDALAIPDFWPPVARVVVSTRGELWLGREVRDGGRSAWEIRDPAGHLTGFLDLPSEVRVLAVDGDLVWTEQLDSMGVPMIALGRVR